MSADDDDVRAMGDASEPRSDSGAHTDTSTARVGEFIDALRSWSEEAPPTPTAELLAVIDGAAGARAVTRRSRHRRKVVVIVTGAVFLGGTGAAAATGRLPGPAQRVVSAVVNTLTPFTVPSHAPGAHSPSELQIRPSDRDHGATTPSPSTHAPSPAQSSPAHVIMPSRPLYTAQPPRSTTPAGIGGGDDHPVGRATHASGGSDDGGDDGVSRPATAKPSPGSTSDDDSAGGSGDGHEGRPTRTHSSPAPSSTANSSSAGDDGGSDGGDD